MLIKIIIFIETMNDDDDEIWKSNCSRGCEILIEILLWNWHHTTVKPNFLTLSPTFNLSPSFSTFSPPCYAHENLTYSNMSSWFHHQIYNFSDLKAGQESERGANLIQKRNSRLHKLNFVMSCVFFFRLLSIDIFFRRRLYFQQWFLVSFITI